MVDSAANSTGSDEANHAANSASADGATSAGTAHSAENAASSSDGSAPPGGAASEGAAPVARETIVDLLGLLAYGELVSFFRLSSDALMAPTLTDKAAHAGLASSEYQHFAQLRDRLAELGVDVESAMRPFISALDAWHEVTQPQNWLESLVKAYVGDGIAGDFYRQVADAVDPETRSLVHGVLDEGERAEFIVARVRAAVEEDPVLSGRLALWGRRLVGEALSQAQRVADDHPGLAELVLSGVEENAENGGISRALARLTEGHNRRLKELGLAT